MFIKQDKMGDAEIVTSAAKAGFDFEWGLRIPMRDGIYLSGTAYHPVGQTEPLPAILCLTPYIADSYLDFAMYYAKNGYVYVCVDCRGRGNSEGKFEPMIHEGPDGHDIVEWMAKQPWCNGKVTMWGGSYGGHDQWQTLRENPPHLVTIIPVASGHPGVDFPFRKNIFGSYDIQWLTFTSGVTPNVKVFGQSAFWIEKFTQMYREHRAFKELDHIVGNTSTQFKTWVGHPIPDAYWDAAVLSAQDMARIDRPILTITGHYDGDQPGALGYYKEHMQSGTEEARKNHYLVIGPWDHAGTRIPKKEFGGLKFGDACLIDINKLNKEWYDWYMKDGQKPEFLQDRVTFYVTGVDEWRYAPTLEACTRATRTLYLGSANGVANDAFHSGWLGEQMLVDSEPDHYTYDPLDTRPGLELEQEEIQAPLTDQRYALNLFGNGLVYHTQPFEQDTEVTGFVKLVAWVSLDVPDTDFSATLYEILADGSSIQLTDDSLRARYRESLRQEKLVTPGEINEYVFDGFTFFSRRIAKNSRLRLVLTSPNTIYLEKNYNSGGVVAEETGADARTAHVTLYHDQQHPSRLELPLG